MKKLIIQIVVLSIASLSYSQTNYGNMIDEIMSNTFTHSDHEANLQTVANRDILLRDSIVERTGEQLERTKRRHYVNNENQLWWIEAVSNMTNTGWNIYTTNVRSFTAQLEVDGIRTLIGPLFNGTPFEDKDHDYNSDGTLSEILTTRFVQTDSTWVNHQKRRYSYDGFLGPQSIDSEWDTLDQTWNDVSSILYLERNEEFFPSILISLTNTVQMVSFVEYTWMGTSNNPETITISKAGTTPIPGDPWLRANYSYANDIQVSQTFEIYNEDTQAYELNSKNEFEYIEETYIDTEDQYTRENGIWVFNKRLIHYYTSQPTPTFEITNSELQVIHANPIRDGATVQIAGVMKYEDNITLNLHDSQGRLVMQHYLQNDQTVNLPTYLPTGMYVLHLMSEDELLYTEKLIKQ